MPTVSVIIPTFNRAGTVCRAVESALNQTCRDLEIVVVDDGSSDGTRDRLASVKDPRLSCVAFPGNRGGSAARNEGIRQAKGAFIAFLDDDDVWESSKIKEQLAVMEKEHTGLCYTGVTKRSFGGRVRRYIFMKPRFSDPVKSIMATNFFGTTSTVMVRKELLEKAGGFDTALPAMQDWDLYIRLLDGGCAFSGIDRPLVRYCIADTARNVSGSFARFKAAEELVRRKYAGHRFHALLTRRLNAVAFIKAAQSRAFMADLLAYHAARLFSRPGR